MAVAATGFFDGVHPGHRKVIETLIRIARERGEESLILTFWPHPRLVLGSAPGSFRLLNGLEEKKSLLYGLGVDRIEVIPFTSDFASMTAREYIGMAAGKYGVSAMVFGYDTRLGSDQLCPDELTSLCRDMGMDSFTVFPVEVETPEGSVTVSSTKIRRALDEGDEGLASSLLGYSK